MVDGIVSLQLANQNAQSVFHLGFLVARILP